MQKRAQIWIESVLYTLIGLAIVGLLLVGARPRIEKMQDQFLIQQTIRALNELDNKVIDIKQATGNRRIIQFQLSKGELVIDSQNDKIVWTLEDSQFMYSEPGAEAEINNIKVRTTDKGGETYDISLTIDYDGINDLTVDKEEISRTLQGARTPYTISIENNGLDAGTNLVQIDIEVA